MRVRCIDDRTSNKKKRVALLKFGEVYNAVQSEKREDCYTIDLGFTLPHVRSVRDFKKKRFLVIANKRKYMSKSEAHAAMVEGHKIAHETFSNDEFLYIERGGYTTIRDEKNYNFNDGWKDRVGGCWEEGWFIWEEAKQVQSVNS